MIGCLFSRGLAFRQERNQSPSKKKKTLPFLLPLSRGRCKPVPRVQPLREGVRREREKHVLGRVDSPVGLPCPAFCGAWEPLSLPWPSLAVPAAPPAPVAAWPTPLASTPPQTFCCSVSSMTPRSPAPARDTVQWLAARGQLAALVLEMAEQGRSTAGLPRDASEAAAGAVLQWPDAAWPWSAYGPVAMAAGVPGPVLGATRRAAQWPRPRRRPAGTVHLAAPARQQLLDALQDGHCGPAARSATARHGARADRPRRRTALTASGSGAPRPDRVVGG